MMATIPMQNAEYVAAGAADSWRHYALNIPVYTHFTSPIRRYADVMVHRILTATLDGTVESTYEVDAIEKTAEHCNDKRLAAKAAQERSDEVSGVDNFTNVPDLKTFDLNPWFQFVKSCVCVQCLCFRHGTKEGLMVNIVMLLRRVRPLCSPGVFGSACRVQSS